MKAKVTLIGTGNMGAAIAAKLLSADYAVTVFNRTVGLKTDALQRSGATLAMTLSDALRAAEHVIVAISDPQAARAVLVSAEAKASLGGRKVILVSLILPAECEVLAAEIGAVGATLSKVVVVAEPTMVADHSAEFIIGGPPEDCAPWEQIFGSIGAKCHLVGVAQNAAEAELRLWLFYVFGNMATAYGMAGARGKKPYHELLESLVRAEDLTDDGPSGQMRSGRYRKDQWTIDNMVTTLEWVIRYMQTLEMPTPVFEAMRDLYAQASAKGWGQSNVAAVHEAILPHAHGATA